MQKLGLYGEHVAAERVDNAEAQVRKITHYGARTYDCEDSPKAKEGELKVKPLFTGVVGTLRTGSVRVAVCVYCGVVC